MLERVDFLNQSRIWWNGRPPSSRGYALHSLQTRSSRDGLFALLHQTEQQFNELVIHTPNTPLVHRRVQGETLAFAVPGAIGVTGTQRTRVYRPNGQEIRSIHGTAYPSPDGRYLLSENGTLGPIT